MMATTLNCLQQAAVIAVREGRVCLVTSQNGRRWVVPKGCMERGKTAGEIALQEAWEEAGLVGTLQKQPVGSYLYDKSGKHYHVTVFLMHVTGATGDWPERDWRTRRWLSPTHALARLEHRGLRALLRKVFAADAAALARSKTIPFAPPAVSSNRVKQTSMMFRSDRTTATASVAG